MSQLPHDEIEELIVADALDGLDQADRDRLARLMGEHGPDCPECRRLEREYREVAGAIALTVDPAAMSAGAEDALIRAARESSAGEPSGPRVIRARGRTWAAAVAVAAVVALIGGVIGYVLAPNEPSGFRTIALQGTVPGQLSLVYQPGRQDAVLVGSGLADPGSGKVYELWYQPSAGAKMVPAGVFTPASGSVTGAPVTVGKSFVLVAVTVEPGPRGSPQPTSQPIFAGPA
jgi:Anti-sigma-K factor rskA